MWEAETDLLRRGKAVGLDSRDYARELGESPGTARARLNGFLELNYAQRKRIVSLIESREREQQASERGQVEVAE